MQESPPNRLLSGSLLSCFLLASACAPLDLLEDDNRRISALRSGADHVAKVNPRDGDFHMANGFASLRESEVSPSGLYFARSAFERAAIIKVDDPIPEYLTGYTFFELGHYSDASRAFVSAALLDRTADGWWLASLAALRAGHELTAQSLYDQGKRSDPGLSVNLGVFMNAMYGAAQQSNDLVINNTLPQINEFKCKDASDEVDGDERLCSSDLEIEFYIIERTIGAGSSVGQDLLGDISFDIYGARTVETTSSTSNPSPFTSISNSISIDIPSLKYDLSFASDNEISDTITATPKMRVSLSKPSSIKSGEKILIVSSGTDFSRAVETQSGVKIVVSLSSFTESGGQVVASVEISDTSKLSIIDGFAQLSNNNSNLDTAVEVSYNTAFVLGSLDYREDIVTGSGQKVLSDIPILGGLFGTAVSESIRKELAVIGVLRQPASIVMNEESQFLSLLDERGIPTASRARRQPIVHTMPSFKGFITELGLFDQTKVMTE